MNALRIASRRALTGVLVCIIALGWPSVTTAQDTCLASAREYYHAGDYFQAAAALSACTDTTVALRHSELFASVLLLSGDINRAWEVVSLHDDSVSAPSLLHLKARIAFARSDFATAYNYYAQLYNLDSLQVTVVRQLAACADQLDSTGVAMAYYRLALRLNPRDRVSGIRLAGKFYDAGLLPEADSLTAQLLERDSLPDLLRLRGDILYRLKDYQQAIVYYQPLLRAGTSDPGLLRKAGICKFMTGETRDAITMLSVSHTLQPDDEVTCYYLGMAYQSAGDFKNAILYLNGAINNGISQNTGVYYQRLAIVYESNGEYGKALQAYESAFTYFPSGSRSRNDMEAELGRVQEVYFEDFKSALRHYNRFLDAVADTSDMGYKRIQDRIRYIENRVK